jgi:hypothetical protein
MNPLPDQQDEDAPVQAFQPPNSTYAMHSQVDNQSGALVPYPHPEYGQPALPPPGVSYQPSMESGGIPQTGHWPAVMTEYNYTQRPQVGREEQVPLMTADIWPSVSQAHAGNMAGNHTLPMVSRQEHHTLQYGYSDYDPSAYAHLPSMGYGGFDNGSSAQMVPDQTMHHGLPSNTSDHTDMISASLVPPAINCSLLGSPAINPSLSVSAAIRPAPSYPTSFGSVPIGTGPFDRAHLDSTAMTFAPSYPKSFSPAASGTGPSYSASFGPVPTNFAPLYPHFYPAPLPTLSGSGYALNGPSLDTTIVHLPYSDSNASHQANNSRPPTEESIPHGVSSYITQFWYTGDPSCTGTAQIPFRQADGTLHPADAFTLPSTFTETLPGNMAAGFIASSSYEDTTRSSGHRPSTIQLHPPSYSQSNTPGLGAQRPVAPTIQSHAQPTIVKESRRKLLDKRKKSRPNRKAPMAGVHSMHFYINPITEREHSKTVTRTRNVTKKSPNACFPCWKDHASVRCFT